MSSKAIKLDAAAIRDLATGAVPRGRTTLDQHFKAIGQPMLPNRAPDCNRRALFWWHCVAVEKELPGAVPGEW
jgi:hypothetical protein